MNTKTKTPTPDESRRAHRWPDAKRVLDTTSLSRGAGEGKPSDLQFWVSLRSMIESGDAIVGSTPDGLAMRARITAEINRLEGKL